MTEKRFVCNFQDKKLVSVRDIENNCNVNILQIVEIANKLSDENNYLKKHLKEKYFKLVKKYNKLHDKLYKKDYFEVESAGEYTEDSRTFKNGLCVYNNRLGMGYSVTEIVEVLNSLVEYKDLVSELFDNKIEILEKDLERAVKAGMPTSILYDEIDELETLKEEVMELWYK